MKHLWPLSLALAGPIWAATPMPPLSAQTASLPQLFKDAYAQQNRGNYTRALRIWNVVIERSPGEPAAFVNRGITRYLMRDLRGAAADLSQAIELKADYANAYFNRAVVYSELKNYDLAVDDYQHYLQLAPDAPDAPQARALLARLRRTAAERSPAPVSIAAPPRKAPTPPPVPAPTGAALPDDESAVPLRPARTEPSAPALALRPASGAVSVGKVSGYDATTDDVLRGLRLSVERGALRRESDVYGRVQNFAVRMQRGSTLDGALTSTGLDRQTFIRLAWRGAAWRTYRIYIK